MPYVPPYNNINDRSARSALSSDIFESEQAISQIDNNIAQAEERLARYQRDGQTTQANLLQATIDNQKAIKARQQEQLDGARNDLTNINNNQDLKPLDSAQDSVTNNTSPAEVEAGTEALTDAEEQTVDENLDATDEEGVVPEVSDKIEPEVTSEEGQLTLTTPEIPITAQYNKAPDSVDLSKVLDNVLLKNASYTYGLSLALMTADEYNKVVKEGEYTPNRVLIASAGRYNNTPGPNQFMRSPYFKEDFYFEGLELKTIIGLNAQSRNSNAVQYKFNLIEPYGFTLLDRIISLCNDPEINCNNYLDMPYMLQIDFFGMGDDGEIKGVIPNTTKRIPIRLNKMETSITERGTEYAVEGVPYNHSAFDITTVTTPANFEVKATTVAQFFNSKESGEEATRQNERESKSNSLYKSTSGKLAQNGQYINPNELNTSLLSQSTKLDIGLITSYGTALNNWYRAAYNAGKIGVNDVYKFKFHDPEIANSPFITGELSSPKDTGMADITRVNSIKRSNLGSNTRDYDPNLKIFQVNAGTYLDRVISWVIRNSKWMQDQIVIPDGEDPETYLQKKAVNKDKPLYWFKVTASINLLGFDKVRKIWAREITYHVNKYEVRNVKLDVAPQGRVKYPVKAYNYIYTGKNDDIIDVDIKFNALYYNALTLYRNQLTKVNPIANNNEEKDKDNPKNYRGAQQDPNAIMPLVMKPQTLDARERASGGSVTAKQVAIADLEASLMTMSQADMMNVDLKILGDPAYIKQDELFWTAALAGQRGESEDETDPRLTYDGSLKMDNGEVYVSLVFRTPIDRDEETGLMKFDGKMELSLFSGLYRVLTVNSTFRQGQFIQTLSLVRLTNQEQLDYAQNKVPTSDNRNSVPGDQAVLDEYLQGPDFTTADKPELTEQIEEGQPAQQNTDLAVTEAEDEPREPDSDILSEINDQADTVPISTENEPASGNPVGIKSTEDEWTDRYIQNEAKQSEVTAQLREANREYTTATQAYNIYGAAAFNQDPTLRGRLEKAVEDRQRLTSELNQLQAEGDAISANRP